MLLVFIYHFNHSFSLHRGRVLPLAARRHHRCLALDERGGLKSKHTTNNHQYLHASQPIVKLSFFSDTQIPTHPYTYQQPQAFALGCGLLKEPSMLTETKLGTWLMLASLHDLAFSNVNKAFMALCEADG